MWLRKKKDGQRRSGAGEHKGHQDVLTDQLSSLGSYTHDYDESEREAVEARLRNMFYGAKVEDRLSSRANTARETVLEEIEDDGDGFNHAING